MERKVGKNTGILEGRFNICTIATLHRFFQENKIDTPTRSALLNEIAETLLSVLVENKMVVPITDYEEASIIMDNYASKRDMRVRGNLGRTIAMQRKEEVNTEEIKRAAIEWMKVNDPAALERYLAGVPTSETQGSETTSSPSSNGISSNGISSGNLSVTNMPDTNVPVFDVSAIGNAVAKGEKDEA